MILWTELSSMAQLVTNLAFRLGMPIEIIWPARIVVGSISIMLSVVSA
jgi:hypothetical protein